MFLASKAPGAGIPAALVLAGPHRVRDLLVEGRRIVQDGDMVTVDLPHVIETQARLARRLAERV